MPLSHTMQQLLREGIDLDFLDELLPPKMKIDGKFYSTYVAEIRPEHAVRVSEKRSIVIKEISQTQLSIYQQLSTVWSPFTETVLGVIPDENSAVAFNEFIPKPSSLTYTTREMQEKRSVTLEDYLSHYGSFTETEALIFLLELCTGLKPLSRLKLTHGDVSPQNILLTDPLPHYPVFYSSLKGKHHTISLKLIDFDITRKQKNREHLVTTVEGTSPFAAPEILDYQTPTDRVDIYSLGCILSYMITGKSPKQLTQQELYSLCSPGICKIISKCTASYHRRYRSLSQLSHALHSTLNAKDLPCWKFLWKIPGFQSPTLAGICLSFCLYLWYFTWFFTAVLSGDSIWDILFPLAGFLLFFDVFHLERLSRRSQFYLEKHLWLRYLLRLLLGLIMPLTFSALIV